MHCRRIYFTVAGIYLKGECVAGIWTGVRCRHPSGCPGEMF